MSILALQSLTDFQLMIYLNYHTPVIAQNQLPST